MADQKIIVLIVDDEPDLLEIVGSFLELEGYTVEKAINATIALQTLQTISPALIISDITMPDISGFEFFNRVRALPNFQNTPFIFLSGHSDYEHIKAGKELGSDDYITKPFDPDILLSTIKGKIKRHQQIKDSVTTQIDQMKTQLFNIMSHEMRTPLTSILGAAEILADGKDSLSPEEFKDFLEMLQSGSSRLNNMVEDFLLVVKIESNDFEKDAQSRECIIVPQQFYVNVFQGYNNIVKKKNLHVKYPTFNKTQNLAIYPPHLKSILQRLMDNAIKFSAPNEAIEVVHSEDEKTCLVSIRDFGVGIPQDKQAEIFQKFYQINREKTVQQGAGLGLYIAKRLAEANKCQLTFESSREKGTAFTLTIPKIS